MAYKLAFPHDPFTPDEWEPGSPIECDGCGDVYDEDDLGDEIRVVDGDYLCRECMQNQQTEPEGESK